MITTPLEKKAQILNYYYYFVNKTCSKIGEGSVVFSFRNSTEVGSFAEAWVKRSAAYPSPEQLLPQQPLSCFPPGEVQPPGRAAPPPSFFGAEEGRRKKALETRERCRWEAWQMTLSTWDSVLKATEGIRKIHRKVFPMQRFSLLFFCSAALSQSLLKSSSTSSIS